MDRWTRALTPDEQHRVTHAEAHAFDLYAGTKTPHRSCGIALAETFGRGTRPYQALRKGGLTGLGPCGAIVAGRLVLGEVLGDPDPTGGVTPLLAEAVRWYDAQIPQRMDRGQAPGDSTVCNVLTGQFAAFRSPERHDFCTALAAVVAQTVAEALLRADALPPLPDPLP